MRKLKKSISQKQMNARVRNWDLFRLNGIEATLFSINANRPDPRLIEAVGFISSIIQDMKEEA